MRADAAGLFTFDLDAIEDAFRAGGQLLIFCNPSTRQPVNPLGRVFTEVLRPPCRSCVLPAATSSPDRALILTTRTTRRSRSGSGVYGCDNLHTLLCRL
jgi:hypothetical protein